MEYRISFTNNIMLSFEYEENIDLHKLDNTKPIVFNNVWLNTDKVVFIEKVEEGDDNV